MHHTLSGRFQNVALEFHSSDFRHICMTFDATGYQWQIRLQKAHKKQINSETQVRHMTLISALASGNISLLQCLANHYLYLSEWS